MKNESENEIPTFDIGLEDRIVKYEDFLHRL